MSLFNALYGNSMLIDLYSPLSSMAWTIPDPFFSYSLTQQFFNHSLFVEEWREVSEGEMLFTPEVPNLFGTKDRFWGRQVFHELEGGRWFWDDLSTLNLLCPFFLLLLSQLHLRSSSIRSLRLRTSALHSPAHRFLPDLDLGTKFTLCLLNLAHMLQWVSGLITYLIWIDPLYSWSFSTNLFRLTLSPLYSQPFHSARNQLLLTVFVPPQSRPSLLEWVAHYSQHYGRMLLPSELGFNVYEMYVMICSGWLSWRKFCWVKLWVWLYISLSCLSFLHFLKVSWTYVSKLPQRNLIRTQGTHLKWKAIS